MKGLYILICCVLVMIGECCGSEGNSYPTDGERLSISLEEAINMALARNRSLISLTNALESDQLNVAVAESAFDLKLTPSTTAGVSDGVSSFSAGVALSKALFSGPVVSVAPELGRSDEDYNGSVSLSMTMPLFRGRGEDVNRAYVRASEFSFRSAQRSYYVSEVNTVISTVSAVYDILRLRDLAQLYRRQINTMTFYAAASEIKKNAGLATPMDVYRAEIRLKDMEDGLSATLQTLADGEENLKRLLSLDAQKTLTVSAPKQYEPVDIDLDGAVDKAIANRIEMDQAKDTLEDGNRQAALARHNLLPQLDLQMGYRRYGEGERAGSMADFTEDQWTINLASTTDFSRTAEKAAYRQSLIRIRNAELDMASQRDTIIAQVKQAMQVLEKNTQRIQIRREQIQQAQGKLELSKIKYKHGMMDNFDVIEAETEIQQAEVNLLAVQTDYIVGLYKLRAVMGTLLERTF
ncbi:MAG: TolC family protein [Pseudomonadota bacterium]